MEVGVSETPDAVEEPVIAAVPVAVAVGIEGVEMVTPCYCFYGVPYKISQ